MCLHTGFAELLLEMKRDPDPAVVNNACAALDGRDRRLLNWITDVKLVALIADNYAVEAHPAIRVARRRSTTGFIGSSRSDNDRSR